MHVCACTCVAPMCTVHAVVAWSSSSSELRLIFTHARARELTTPYSRIIVAFVEFETRRDAGKYQLYVTTFGCVYLEKRGGRRKLPAVAQQQTDRNPKNNIYSNLLPVAIASTNAYNHLYEFVTRFRKRTRTRRLRRARTR